MREVITLSSDDSEDDVQVMENQENARRARMNLLPLGPPAARGAAYDARRPRYQTELEREVRIAGRRKLDSVPSCSINSIPLNIGSTLHRNEQKNLS